MIDLGSTYERYYWGYITILSIEHYLKKHYFPTEKWFKNYFHR